MQPEVLWPLVGSLAAYLTFDLAAALAIFDKRQIKRQMRAIYQKLLRHKQKLMELLKRLTRELLCLLLGGRNSAICRSLFEGHIAPILAFDVDFDRQQLATASADGTIKIWDLTIGNLGE